jgi:hypothetical protein
MVMDDDSEFEALRRQELSLLRAFLGIADSSKRQRVLDLAEQLANAPKLGSAKVVSMDERQDAPGQTK